MTSLLLIRKLFEKLYCFSSFIDSNQKQKHYQTCDKSIETIPSWITNMVIKSSVLFTRETLISYGNEILGLKMASAKNLSTALQFQPFSGKTCQNLFILKKWPPSRARAIGPQMVRTKQSENTAKLPKHFLAKNVSIS